MVEQPAGDHGRILVAEDDADIREMIAAQLRREPYGVIAVGSVAEVYAAMNAGSADLLVLDLNLPDGDGIDLCRQLRAQGHDGPIIMVTARVAPIDRVLGLELGADDYLTKPFEPRELLARIRNLLRRHRGPTSRRPRGARLARFGDWRLDLRQRRLIAADDGLVMLSSAEYRLLCRFLDAPDKVLSREELLRERTGRSSTHRAIDLQISRLRQKLGSEPGGEAIILTARNEGYVMPGPVSFE
jgi:two-component system OmpR family response regulator